MAWYNAQVYYCTPSLGEEVADYVTLATLADELGLDRSNMRKYVIKHGFEPITARPVGTRGQLTLALAPEDAEAVRALRKRQGFGGERVAAPSETGSVYVVQVVPELAPNRVKLGFAGDVIARLFAHQTSAPTACLVKSWPCRKSWETAAIASLTRIGCTPIGSEVFDCDVLNELVDRGDAFFALMP